MPLEITDLDEVVLAWAKEMYELTKRKDVKADKDSLNYNIKWHRVRFDHGDPEFGDGIRPGNPKSQSLFKTTFTNNTDNEQEYSFSAERSTSFSCEVSIEKGVTVGEELSCTLATPSSILEVSGSYSREFSLSKSSGETIEQTMTWRVDSNVKVPPRFHTRAEMIVNEDQYGADFKVDTKIEGRLLVTVTNPKDNNCLVKTIEGSVSEVFRGLKGFTVEKNHVMYTTRGKCHFRFGLDQHVLLHEEPIS